MISSHPSQALSRTYSALTDPSGQPIAGENVTLTAGRAELGTFKTGSDGIVRASYVATETGTLVVGASFAGSTSYAPSSDSKTLAVTPAPSPRGSFPWVLLVILVVLFVGLAAYMKRRESGRAQGGQNEKASA